MPDPTQESISLAALPDSNALAHVLDFLCETSGVEFQHEKALESIRRVRRELPAAGVPTWRFLVMRTAADLGLSIYGFQQELTASLTVVHPKAPLLTWAHGEMKGYVALLDVRRKKVLLQELETDGAPRWLPTKNLPALLGLEDGQTPEWIIAEPAGPLDDMRSPETGHGDGHGDHHHGLSPFRRLRKLLKAEKGDLWVVVIYSIIVGLLSLVLPVAVQSLVNSVAFGTVLQPLVVLTLFVLVALLFSGLMTALRLYVVEIMQRRIFVRVAGDATYRLLRVRADAFDRLHGPELVNRFFDVVTVQKSGAMLLMEGLSITMQTVIGMVLLALYHPLLLAFDVILLAAIAYILFFLGAGAVRTSIEESRAKYAMAAWLEEIARHTITFKSPGGANYAREHSDTLVRSYLTGRKSHFRILLRQVVGSLVLQALASAVLLGIGGWLVIDRQLTLGQLVAAELIVTTVVGGFTKFGKQLEVFYDLMAAMDKLGHLIDLPLERSGGESLTVDVTPARLDFHDISFGYPNRPGILKDASWEIAAGERVALLGRGGSGKSAIADMIYGLRLPHSGVVLLDGIDYRDFTLQDLRHQISLVRASEVFEGSLLDNVRLGRSGLSLHDVREALARVSLLDEVLRLPDGLQTELLTGGLPLSPGQVVRLMLARAIVGRPRLLVVDDLLDAIDDTEGRQALLSTLFADDAPWTLVAITSSPDIVARCHRAFVVENGGLSLLETSGRRAFDRDTRL